jgi:acyl transferase domain-containing protein
MSGRFPGARNLEDFWQNLRNGVESISFFSPQELAAAGVSPAISNHPDFVNAGGILDGIELFDASFFGFSPREAEILDPQQRLLLECAWQALEDSGYDPDRYEGAIGVYAGGILSSYLFNLLSNREHREIAGDFQVFTGNDKDHLSTRVSYKLNLKGPSVTVQTACSTSLVAVAMACQSLATYQCDMALAGGVAVRVPQKAGYIHQEGMIFSRDGHCRPFDAGASGTIFSNGVGLVVLKRLADALADRDFIYALIKGSAVNNDGSLKVGYTAPGLDAQAEVIAMAHAIAEVDPATISYVEAHGTATPLGDPIEIAALSKAFKSGKNHKKSCALGSIKSNLGHLDAAAGVAGLIKTALCLRYGLIPPSINFQRPNPVINFADGPFYVNTQLMPWQNGSVPRRAGVSSFGIGGTNAHVVLEEAPPNGSSLSRRSSHLLLLSARSNSALEAMTASFATYLRKKNDLNPADVAYTCQVGRRAFNRRRVLVYHELADAVAALEPVDGQRVLTASKPVGECSIAFMFPGQGAQRVNMGLGLYRSEPTFRKHIDDCSESLKNRLGFDLRGILYPPAGDEEEAAFLLEQTAAAQPALFVVEYALAKLWMEWGVRPQIMIGHSIGEYVAACVAGVLALEDTLLLVTERGRLMQRLSRGSMLAVPLPEREVRALLDADLDVAAINHPDSCVVSGPTEPMEKFKARLNETGVECRHLHTSHAFHSRMMDPILEEFTSLVATVPRHAPQIPYLSNVTGTWITTEHATDPAYWARHLRRTVLFSQGVAALLNACNRTLLEVGPGRTLTTLVRRHPGRTNEHVVFASLGGLETHDSDADGMLNGLGRLWLLGTKVDWAAFWRHESRNRVPLPTYPFERKSYWIEPCGEPEIPGHGPRPKSVKSDVADWFYVPCWKQAIPLEAYVRDAGSDSGARWLIFEDECGVGAEVSKQLEQTSHTVVRVRQGAHFEQIKASEFQLDSQQEGDYGRLLNALRDSGRLPQIVLHCWNVTGRVPQLQNYSDSSGLSAFNNLLFLAQALGDYCFGNPLRIGLVSSDLHLVIGTEKVGPEKASVLGFCRVIPQEYSSFDCRNVDISLDTSAQEIPKSLIDSLVAEMKSESSESVVAYRGNKRWIQTYESVRLPRSIGTKTFLREQGVYLVTGGLGGIGLTLAKYLAQAVRAKLVLVGRSRIPPRAEWPTGGEGNDRLSQSIRELLIIEAAGGEILTLAADVTDRGQMEEVVRKTCQRFGAIHGVIHAAGIAGGGMIQLRSAESAAAVMAPKIKGTWVLDAVLKNVKLDFLVLCSSISSILGGTGLADYSSANAFLDAHAQQQSSRGGYPVISVNWDAWEETGMAAAKNFKLNGRPRITPAEGVEAFRRILAAGLPQVVVATTDLQTAAQGDISTISEAKAVLDEEVTKPEELARGNSQAGALDDVERVIAEMWQKLLGIQQPGVYDNFFELGGDSLLGTRLLSLLRSAFSVQLPLQSLLEVPTVAGMAQRIRALR